MFYGDNREQLRQVFFETHRKLRAGDPLEPLERVVGEVIGWHAEYHRLLEDERALGKDYTPEHGQTNPFLHMGMHIAIREQIETDRPPGITDVYASLARRCADPHVLEHAMMECLGEMLWEAQRAGRPPDEGRYLERLRSLRPG